MSVAIGRATLIDCARDCFHSSSSSPYSSSFLSFFGCLLACSFAHPPARFLPSSPPPRLHLRSHTLTLLQDVNELEPGICPGQNGPDTPSPCTCVADLTCQAPRYYNGDQYLGTYNPFTGNAGNTPAQSEDFGLDVYEPDFLQTFGNWGEGVIAPGYNMKIYFDEGGTTYKGDIFYFCHVHPNMDGRIKMLNNAGEVIQAADSPPLPANPTAVGAEVACGTVDLNSFLNADNNKCPMTYLCTEGLTYSAEMTTFNDCMSAVDCAMDTRMKVVANQTNPSVTFSEQMIWHHRNAIDVSFISPPHNAAHGSGIMQR